MNELEKVNRNELERINKSALEYALHSIPRMRELSTPLRKYLGINSFGYMRTYSDCKYLSLLDGHDDYTKKFFEIIPKSDPHFIKALQNSPYGEATFALWPTSFSKNSPIMSLLNDYNLWHGFQITYRREEYCEMFSFTFNKQSDDKSSFYIQNIPILLKFISFFKSQAIDLIECNNKSNLAIFPEKFSTEFIDNNNSYQFLLDINKSLILKDTFGNSINLTHRESECLKIFVKNRTSKEIALTLGISPRTAELHIQNIKRKLGINYKSQLVDIYTKSFY